jgi:hypothetical protein
VDSLTIYRGNRESKETRQLNGVSGLIVLLFGLAMGCVGSCGLGGGLLVGNLQLLLLLRVVGIVVGEIVEQLVVSWSQKKRITILVAIDNFGLVVVDIVANT